MDCGSQTPRAATKGTRTRIDPQNAFRRLKTHGFAVADPRRGLSI